MSLEALKYQHGRLEVLNQLVLPHATLYEQVLTADDGWTQIRTMKVRGAPAIAIVAALSVAVELFHLKESSPKKARNFKDGAELVEFIRDRWEHLKTSRPTAVNLFDAAKKFVALMEEALEQNPTATVDALINVYLDQAEKFLKQDIEDNKNIGKHGGQRISALAKPSAGGLRMLTICNTGSLATAGYGTALGVIRYLHETGSLKHAYCLETRPYNQGSRLTAYELVHDKIPSTLITDSMAAALMKKGEISAVVVGADRVVANGDTANKIGTYQLAIVAQYHQVPFYVCAPVTSIDTNIASGEDIPIEERKPEELAQVSGALVDSAGIVEPLALKTVQVSAKGIEIWNPAFDVTPAKLITGIVTEKGVILKKEGETEFRVKEFLASLPL